MNVVLENKNIPTSHVKKSPVKANNKTKRKAMAAENRSKQGALNKPIPLAEAAAAVHEAPVLSIQQIQEEERQLLEAIEKSKQDTDYATNSQPNSPVFLGRNSPNIASNKQELSQFNDVLKSQQNIVSSSETATERQFYPGRVS